MRGCWPENAGGCQGMLLLCSLVSSMTFISPSRPSPQSVQVHGVIPPLEQELALPFVELQKGLSAHFSSLARSSWTKHHHTGEQTTAPSFVLSTIQPCLVLQSLVVLTPPTKISDSGKYQMSSQNPVIVTSLKKYTQGGVVWLHLKSLGFSAVFANFRPASRRKMLYCSDILQNKSEIFLSKTCWS